MKLLTPQPVLEHFGLATFVCLDFETTGLEPADCEIIEAGAVKVENGEVTDTFHSLLSIEGDLPEAITNLTGIRNEDLEGQPPVSEVIPALVSFIGDAPLIAHNLSFDLGFFKEMLIRLSEFSLLEKLALDSDKHWDILLLARVVLPLLHSHRLESLIESFHIASNVQHRALEDVKAEIQIFDRLLAKSVEIPNEALAMLVTITRGKRKFYAKYFQLLHELRGKKYNLLVQDPLPDISIDYPVSRNILRKRTTGNEYKENKFVRRDVIAVFEEGGALSSGLSDYEVRQEQIDMAQEVSRAYENEEFLLAEAGTGTGKSWAYLVPAVFWSYANQDETSRTVVSTNTKNLQDQIFYKDLPFLHQHLPVNFQAALLKGRGNYLCLNRWYKFLSQIDFATDPNLMENILPLIVWANETNTGDIEEVNWFSPQRAAKVWSQIQSDGYYCLGQACRYKDQCFVNQIRRAARESNIVVINHSLLLSDLISDNAVLSDYVNLIVDEAHNLENTAAQFLGQDWSFWSLRQLALHFDVSAVDKPNELDHIERLLQRQSWLDNNTLKTIQLNMAQLRSEAGRLKSVNDEFFKSLYANLGRKKTGATTYSRKIRYKNWAKEYAALQDHTAELFQAFSLFQKELERLQSNLSEIPTTKFSKDDNDSFEENLIFIQGILSDSLKWGQTLHHLLVDNQNEIVYWIEDLNRKEGFDIHFRSAPLNVANLLNDVLYPKLRTSVFTSATLSVKHEFDFFEQRMGFDLLPPERVNTKIVGSPFDYEDQMHVLIPKYMPNPNQIQFIGKTSHLIERSVEETRRSTLVLFTSYKMLNQVFEQLKSTLHTNDLIAVAQGKSGSRINLLRMLTEGKAHALLGTHSFWEGVDLPGDALEILFITKLPFEVPSEPIVEARIEQMDQKGENSFYGYSLPNAVLKFRQGIGRLIRSRNDRGVVVLLDPRLVTSRYGSFFLNSMPVMPTIVNNDEEFIQNLLNWFD